MLLYKSVDQVPTRHFHMPAEQRLWHASTAEKELGHLIQVRLVLRRKVWRSTKVKVARNLGGRGTFTC